MSEEGFIPKFAKELVERRIDECGKQSKESMQRTEKYSDIESKTLGATDASLYRDLETLFMLQKLNFHLVDHLVDAIEKLPKRDEFDKVKQELLIARKGVRDVVEPTFKRVKEAEEREKRANVYG